MRRFSKKLKNIFNSINPYYEINKESDRFQELRIKLNENRLDYIIKEFERIENMSDEERIEYKKNLLKEEANNIIDKLESNSELYKEYNNIMRRKKIKKLESNE